MTLPPSKLHKSGFTLVEMLVVVAIIITLAFLSFLGISGMRNSANKARASHNLSQIQLANINYATDNNGKFVPFFTFDGDSKLSGSWYSNPKFLVYLKSEGAVYTATKTDISIPLNMLDPAVLQAKKKFHDQMVANFGYNETGMPGGSWGNPNASPCFMMSQLTAPERSAAFITSTDWGIKYGGRYNWKDAGAVEGKTSDGKIAFRHRGKALVAYYDGHMGEITISDLKNFDQQGGAKNIFWNAAATATQP